MNSDRFVRRTTMVGVQRGREFSLEWGEQSRVREIRAWFVGGSPNSYFGEEDLDESFGTVGEIPRWSLPFVSALQVTWTTDDGIRMVSPVIGQAPLDADGHVVRWDDSVVLGDDAVLNGLAGSHAGGRLRSMGPITQDDELVESVGEQLDGQTYAWSLKSMLGDPRFQYRLDHMPADALISGIFGRYDRAGLCGIGLRCMVDGVPPVVLRWGPGGRVVPVADTGKPPSVDHTRVPATPSEHPDNADRLDHIGAPAHETARPNPNHRPIDVRRIEQWDDTLRVHWYDSGDETFGTEHFSYAGRGVDEFGQRWTNKFTGEDGRPVTISIGPNEASIEMFDGSVFTQPSLPPIAASDGPTWDNVFSLDRRVDYLSWAFCGLDISRLDPFNFQESSGALHQEVFRAPAPGSREFHVARDGKATVVPNGWQFAGDVSGSSGSRTSSSFSDEESRQSWATSLGVSASADVGAEGFSAKVAYRNNQKAHNEVSSGSSGKVVSTISETVETAHSLVLDLATVELSSGFRQAVEELAKNQGRERLREFIDRFGTHFAASLTFGSKQWEQRHETEASVTHAMTHGTSSDQSVDVDARTPIGGVSEGVSWGAQNEASNSSKHGVGLDVSSRGSVGSANEPVPVQMEVKPLTHLLSPLFFDDPYVYEELRPWIDEFLDLEFEPALTYNDTRGSLNFDIFPLIPNGAEQEGQGVRDDLGGWWVIRGGKRHRIPEGPRRNTIPWFLTYLTMRDEELRDFPDSGETLTIDGMLIRIDKDTLPAGSPYTGRMVWLLKSGKRHLVPTVAVAEVLGGAQLIKEVPQVIFDQFEVGRTPASVEGRMIKLKDDSPGMPEEDSGVWVIHERERHRVTDLAIRRLGGWQQIAIVRPEVLNWFPRSGRTIR